MACVSTFLVCLVSLAGPTLLAQQKAELPSFDYDTARTHEIKPHRRTIPHNGVTEVFNQLDLTLTVSAAGDVTAAEAVGRASDLKFWPDLKPEVMSWKFTPFEVNGKHVAASVEEYIDLVPPEELPTVHVQAPEIRPDSTVTIKLDRSECFGTCPSYEVTVSTDGIIYEGRSYVAVKGKRTAKIDPNDVRALAKRIVFADFYSMKDDYVAIVTDNPTFKLSIDIDGKTKSVTDYIGQEVGMPAVIKDLEVAVDELARTDRWIGHRGR
jgi:hypothetical protein